MRVARPEPARRLERIPGTMSEFLQSFLKGLLGTSQLDAWQQLGSATGKVVLALVIGGAAWFLAIRVRNAIQHTYTQTKGDLGLGILLGRLGYFAVLTLGILLILPIFGLSATAVVATLGVLGLAISLAMQDVLKNIFAGMYLLVERPFRPGDLLKVRDFVGTVESVDLRTTTLRADGEVIYVPNAILFSEILVNRGLPKPIVEQSVE
jgi:small conductance mechanosensitive channel